MESKNIRWIQRFSNLKKAFFKLKEAVESGQLSELENGWMLLKKSRENTSHTYNKEIAEEIVKKIVTSYYFLFEDLITKLEHEVGGTKQEKLF